MILINKTTVSLIYYLLDEYTLFELSTTKEIINELSSRAKVKRKKIGLTQKQFADHIGMKFSTYARFEKTGLIPLNNFIDTLRGLYSIGDLEAILIDENENLKIKR